MATFTMFISDDLLQPLNERSGKLGITKDKLIEEALRLYLDCLEKAEYICSYKRATGDEDLIRIAEENMADYVSQIENDRGDS